MLFPNSKAPTDSAEEAIFLSPARYLERDESHRDHRRLGRTHGPIEKDHLIHHHGAGEKQQFDRLVRFSSGPPERPCAGGPHRLQLEHERDDLRPCHVLRVYLACRRRSSSILRNASQSKYDHYYHYAELVDAAGKRLAAVKGNGSTAVKFPAKGVYTLFVAARKTTGFQSWAAPFLWPPPSQSSPSPSRRGAGNSPYRSPMIHTCAGSERPCRPSSTIQAPSRGGPPSRGACWSCSGASFPSRIHTGRAPAAEAPLGARPMNPEKPFRAPLETRGGKTHSHPVPPPSPPREEPTPPPDGEVVAKGGPICFNPLFPPAAAGSNGRTPPSFPPCGSRERSSPFPSLSCGSSFREAALFAHRPGGRRLESTSTGREASLPSK